MLEGVFVCGGGGGGGEMLEGEGDKGVLTHDSSSVVSPSNVRQLPQCEPIQLLAKPALDDRVKRVGVVLSFVIITVVYGSYRYCSGADTKHACM